MQVRDADADADADAMREDGASERRNASSPGSDVEDEGAASEEVWKPRGCPHHVATGTRSGSGVRAVGMSRRRLCLGDTLLPLTGCGEDLRHAVLFGDWRIEISPKTW